MNFPCFLMLILFSFFKVNAQLDSIQKEGYILLNENDFSESDQSENNNFSGVLTASKDLFSRTVAYEFSASFFRPKSLSNTQETIVLNGTPVNKIFNGRPEWNNWGGLNDVFRNIENTKGIEPHTFNFGGLYNTSNFNLNASSYANFTKISFASSNRSYKGRTMATYSSGKQKNGWSGIFSGSYRFADEGFKEGSVYQSFSFFSSVEKEINQNQSINLLAIISSTKRGKSSAITNEVYQLKNNQYNAYWGNQNKDLRNSRIKDINQPIIQLSHQYKINSKSNLRTNITYQFGKIKNSRLDYGGSQLINNHNQQTITGRGANPDPTYYQKLPSYFLRDQENPDYANAYLAEKNFVENGQIDWITIYENNQNGLANGNSIYVLYDDVTNEKQLSFNSILNYKISNKFSLNSSIAFQNYNSNNYAELSDLLGGNGYLDIDSFTHNLNEAQNDLKNPNRIVKEEDKFKYNFDLQALKIDAFSTLNFQSYKTNAYLSINYNSTSYQRNGLFENGAFPANESLGKSEKINFSNFSFKSGLTYKLNGRNLFILNSSIINRSPILQNSFSNIRENNQTVLNLKNEQHHYIDFAYILRHPKINSRISTYWISQKNKTQISFYYADGLTGLENYQTNAFVQEVLTGIEHENFGVELSAEVPITQELKVKGVASIGQSIFSSNPNLYITSDDFKDPISYGKSYLNNYHTSVGPQEAYSFGFEYSSSKYWWLSLTGNYFKNAYINIAPITRTSNFLLDTDGKPITDFDEQTARKLLKQEEIKPYYLVNLVGGKSWKIDEYYFGFFASINNLLNKDYKTGGYEQSRNANYDTLLEDQSRNLPLFSPKYWFGYGTTYFLSVYFKI